jgi:hypothetical protein
LGKKRLEPLRSRSQAAQKGSAQGQLRDGSAHRLIGSELSRWQHYIKPVKPVPRVRVSRGFQSANSHRLAPAPVPTRTRNPHGFYDKPVAFPSALVVLEPRELPRGPFRSSTRHCCRNGYAREFKRLCTEFKRLCMEIKPVQSCLQRYRVPISTMGHHSVITGEISASLSGDEKSSCVKGV